jgi:folate-dependent phosphoribosylglycinamide formyltransferase PurN
MENFATEPRFLHTFARHYKTGATIPDELVDRIVQSRKFQAAYNCIRQISFGMLDMGFYTRQQPIEEPVEEFEQKMIEVLEIRGAELIVMAGFLRILSADFTDRFENRMINVHPSLIPSFCGKGFYGLKVHEAALSYGVKLTGATVHYVNSIPDGGQIIEQKAVRIKKGDTPETLQRRVMEQAEWKILPAAVQKICRQIRKEKENA